MEKEIAFIGLQWGDEGKGKVLHYAVSEAVQRSSFDNQFLGISPVAVERYQGGGNAGHTIYYKDVKQVLHYIPSGIFFPEVYNLCSAGMYLEPRKLMKEIQGLQQQGVSINSQNLGIAANAHITLDHHLLDDEKDLMKPVHTSTGNGIKPTAVDKYGRVGLRLIEFLERKVMADGLKRMFPEGVPARYESPEQYAHSYEQEREFLAQFLVQDHRARQQQGQQYWLLEGAQGVMLDVDVGNYPGVTSSHVIHFPVRPDSVIGVVKLYCSSVGLGDRPFVSQLPAELEDKVRREWGEFGATTGRPRAVGWFDAVAARYAAEVAGVEGLVGTCGDRLETLARLEVKPEIVVAYEIEGRKYESWEVLFHRRDVLYKARPITEKFEPWKKFTEPGGKVLTPAAQRYVSRIEQLVGKRFCLLGTGAKEQEMIVYHDIFELENEGMLRK
ncbi:MAG: adenylosuccinate synthetase [Nanoarchaeota archaeon]